MRKRINVDDLPVFDAARHLKSEEAIAAYLTDILEANDAALLAAAKGDIARVHGMIDQVSKTTEQASSAKPRYFLKDLLAQCDANAPVPEDMKAWEGMDAVGNEILTDGKQQ